MYEDVLPKELRGKVTTYTKNGCWEWEKYKNPAGYGQVRINGKLWLVHRYVLMQILGEIPDNLFVWHTCDNPACCRPSHLRLGTHTQNMADAALKKRINAGEANTGAKLTAEQVGLIREAYAKGISQAELARRFQVNRSCIYKIVTRLHWSHI